MALTPKQQLAAMAGLGRTAKYILEGKHPIDAYRSAVRDAHKEHRAPQAAQPQSAPPEILEPSEAAQDESDDEREIATCAVVLAASEAYHRSLELSDASDPDRQREAFRAMARATLDEPPQELLDLVRSILTG